MPKLEKIDKPVEFNIDVKKNSSYKLHFKIGFEQPGNIMKVNGIKTEPMPPQVGSSWETTIGTGETIRGEKLRVYVTARNENPNFNDLGVTVDLIDETTGKSDELVPTVAGSNILNDVAKTQVATFKVKLNFI